MARFVEGKPARSFAQLYRMGIKTISISVNDRAVPGAHPGDVSAVSVGSPRNRPRIANGFVFLRLGQTADSIIKVRVQISDGFGKIEWIYHGHFHADEDAV